MVSVREVTPRANNVYQITVNYDEAQLLADILSIVSAPCDGTRADTSARILAAIQNAGVIPDKYLEDIEPGACITFKEEEDK